MPCRPLDLGNGVTGFACSRGERTKPCVECGRASNKLCDGELRGKMQGKTCDRPLCARCAIKVGPDKDLCHAHARVAGKL